MNENYLGHRLVYTDVRTAFDPLVNSEYLKALVSRAIVIAMIWAVGGVILLLVASVLGAVGAGLFADSSDFDGGDGAGAVLSFVAFIIVAWTAGAIGLFLLIPLPAQLSEWMLTIDGKGNRALAALDHMYAIIDARRAPLKNLAVVQLTAPAQPRRDYLQLTDGPYLGYVSSFAYGSDLFIGWTFWLYLSPLRWLMMHFGRLWRAVTLRKSGLFHNLAYDQPKAMREVMHSAVRQGIEVATGDAEPAGQGAIGRDVPLAAARF